MSTLAILPTDTGWAGDALDYGNQQGAAVSADSSGWEGDSLDYGAAAGGGSVPFPIDDIFPEEVRLIPLRAQAATRSPTTFITQVQDRGGAAWHLSMRLGDMDAELAALVIPILQTLAAQRNVLALDIDRWCPGVSPAPGVRLFRVTGARLGWQSQGGVVFGARIEALETESSGAASDIITPALSWWEGGDLDYSLPTQNNILPGLPSWEGANDSAA